MRLAIASALAALAVLGVAVAIASSGGDERRVAAADPAVPAAEEALPRSPARLARRLTEVSRGLRGSIDAWRSEGDLIRGEAPDAVQLQALYQQRVFRLLARRRALGSATLRRLPGWLAPTARDSVAALRNLFRLAAQYRGRRHSTYRTGRALPPGVLLRHYRAAQRRFGVGWHVLAAVNLVETGFNRLRNNSVAGAQGPMQFIPSTWRAYGMRGNIRDPRDAIFGAANYLRASGAPRNYGRALYAYNHSPLYVDAVLRYARRMRGRGFLAFYNWQVFVRSRSDGERRLTGPGR